MKQSAVIDLTKDATYIVRNQQIEEVLKPETGHGKQIIHWQGDKPCHCTLETNIKFK